MNKVKHKVYGRQLIHAHVKKIQPALASLVGSQSRQLSYIVRLWITKWLGNHQIVFLQIRVQSCFQRNSFLRAWGPVECSRARPAPMSGAAGNLLHPQPRIRQPPQVPWTAAVPKSRVKTSSHNLSHRPKSKSSTSPAQGTPSIAQHTTGHLPTSWHHRLRSC